jgi:hypothetical protein
MGSKEVAWEEWGVLVWLRTRNKGWILVTKATSIRFPQIIHNYFSR